MGPRWKGKGSKAKALADPMSKIVLQLQSSLIQSNSEGLLCGCSVLLSVEAQQADLLNRSCLGEPMVIAERDKQWFELGMEEAFYLCYALKGLNIVEDECLKSNDQLWQCMKSRRALFPYLYKAYSHLRMKNWVVMSGITYGADFVAYRHHPELVHSEYAVIVSSEEEGESNKRLRVWYDVHCATRLCGGVAKTLLVLDISKNGHSADSPSCLESYTVKERTITRWNPEQCREDYTIVDSENVAKFYYEPHTQKQFRSLKAVKEFLRREAPQSEQLQGPEASQADNHAQASSSNFNLSSTEKKRKTLAFNLGMPPQRLTWVLTDVESDEWSPYVHDAKIPDAVKNHWAQTFASITGGNV